MELKLEISILWSRDLPGFFLWRKSNEAYKQKRMFPTSMMARVLLYFSEISLLLDQENEWKSSISWIKESILKNDIKQSPWKLSLCCPCSNMRKIWNNWNESLWNSKIAENLRYCCISVQRPPLKINGRKSRSKKPFKFRKTRNYWRERMEQNTWQCV